MGMLALWVKPRAPLIASATERSLGMQQPQGQGQEHLSMAPVMGTRGRA